jgi:hypothetical protein
MPTKTYDTLLGLRTGFQVLDADARKGEFEILPW